MGEAYARWLTRHGSLMRHRGSEPIGITFWSGWTGRVGGAGFGGFLGADGFSFAAFALVFAAAG
jgi:hypothetical protein